MDTFNEIYILDLHGNSLKKESSPDGGKDENVFDIRQGVAIALFIKQKGKQGCRVFHRDLYGLREEKYDWLSNNVLNKHHYTEIEPVSPWYFFIPRHTENIRHYLQWKQITDIFPVNGVGITTARDNFVIDMDRTSLENRIRLFKNSTYNDENLHQFFGINKKKGWNIRKAWNMLQQIRDSEVKNSILNISYRPFDIRYIFWHDSLVWRTVKQVMRHMLHDNIAITTVRQVKTGETWQHALVSDKLVESCYVSNKTGEISYVLPLYLYDTPENKSKRSSHLQTVLLFEPNEKYHTRKPNIDKKLYETLNTTYNKELTPEEILYYIYGIFYSNVYRDKYAEFLKIDFPRVPFTKDYAIFRKISILGNRLADLHLMKSKELDNPVSKYEGEGNNDKIEKTVYDERKKRIYINKNKYFDNISPEVWNYHIGGYQVLQKYLRDRKGRFMDDPRHFCRIITALTKTIEIQEQLDDIYMEVETDLLDEL